MQLRPYQAKAVEAVYQHLRTRTDNPCVVIPTGGGKTPIIATICSDAVLQWSGRVIVLAPSKELITQAADKLRQVCPDVRYGVNSAGLGRREKDEPVILAGIQSVYKRACELGPFDLALIDEAHLIPPDGEGMYRTFLEDAKVVNPNIRLIGLTATPYRMKAGEICAPQNILNHVCYEIGVKELIVGGYLCPLTTKAGRQKADLSKVHIRAGEFIEEEASDALGAIVEAAVAEIIERTADRKAVLIFAQGVKHGLKIKAALTAAGMEAGFVASSTEEGIDDRDEAIRRFQGAAGGLFGTSPLKYLINVNTLTTGFDAPHVDCVVLFRMTQSEGLYYQMVGRGFRLHPSKVDCLILDFGQNIARHGPVDQIKVGKRGGRNGAAGAEPPAKECDQCQAMVAPGYSRCPQCGHEFPPPNRKQHGTTPDTETPILSQPPRDTRYDVQDIKYRVHTKKDAPDAPQTLRVDYMLGLNHWVSEWLCFGHPPGFARDKACQWWIKRSRDPIPEDAESAAVAAEAGALANTHSVTVREVWGEKFPRIVDYELGVIPLPIESTGEDPEPPEWMNIPRHDEEEDIPF